MKKINYLSLLLVFLVSINSCKKDDSKIEETDNANLATVETVSVSNIFISTANGGGNITNNGGAQIADRGICYGTNPNPTSNDNTTSSGRGTGSFISRLNNLTPNTIYYVRAYAINRKGIAYGNEVQFVTQDVAGIVTDIDGNTYQSVVIDDKVWMTEDLRVTHYPNGDAIPNITDNTTWTNLSDNNTDDAYCFYNNNNSTDYGALYTYAAAIGDNWQKDNSNIDGESGQGLCPNGWHLATNSEWVALRSYLVNNGNSYQSAGGEMKEVGTLHWNSPNTGATNSSRFNALPGGDRFPSGEFRGLKDVSVWWSATDYAGTMAHYWLTSYNSAILNHQFSLKSGGYCVRCVRD